MSIVWEERGTYVSDAFYDVSFKPFFLKTTVSRLASGGGRFHIFISVPVRARNIGYVHPVSKIAHVAKMTSVVSSQRQKRVRFRGSKFSYVTASLRVARQEKTGMSVAASPVLNSVSLSPSLSLPN